MFLVTLFYIFISFGFLPHFFASAAPRPRFTKHSALARGLVSDSADITAFLAEHNTVRTAHNAPPLTWSGELALKAAIWANVCQFKHSDGLLSYKPYGENIVAATGDFSIPAAMGTFVQDAGMKLCLANFFLTKNSKSADYNPANPTYTHFTQVIWKSTTQLGCAVSKCDGIFDRSFGKATLYVCLYNPAGNVVGDAP
jgi:pathogenesis-related protein 1